MIRRILIPILTLALGATSVPGPARANPGQIADIICAPSQEMHIRLKNRFHSERVWQGIRAPDQVMELWQDPNGDWVLTVAYAGGKLCIVAIGTALTPFHDMS